ncbi:MAG TPA: RimK family protein [Phycisphaerales bacterium]|nr:RimK family protein [Phycisphaerales bacterium]HMP38446.1 RimK family protein [Phycisphaerales bacterium]
MPALVIVDDLSDWSLELPGVQVVTSRAYLTEEAYSALRGAKVFNLCRSYRYQSFGYYVSLLATARGHRPLPSVVTVQDLKTAGIVRAFGGELDELIQKNLQRITGREFDLSIYFGRNLAARYDRLGREIFNLFPAPLLRAHFTSDGERWRLASVRPIPLSEVPPTHTTFVQQVAGEYFAGRQPGPSRRRQGQYDLAILHDPAAESGPSNEKAMRRFEHAAEEAGFDVTFITREDYGLIAEFDALFIRDTTAVNHYTYRFSRKGVAEGLVVIDDPESIVRCSNKVYLAELLARHRISTPRTLVIDAESIARIEGELGFPCVLKQPDSAFSRGVVKIDGPEALRAEVSRLLDASDLIVAQEYLRTDFDWRVGVLDGAALFACRYHMAPQHWQIVRRDRPGKSEFGQVDAIPIDLVPPKVLRTAVKAASLIGDGLYGVDLKQVGNAVHVIEVNDNPNVDAGYEDAILKDRLYEAIIEVFARRVRARGRE